MSTGRAFIYILAAVLILIGLGLAVVLGLSLLAQHVVGTGIVFLIVGILFILGGAYLVYQAGRGKGATITQNVTYKVDLPANIKIDELKCRSCGGTLTMDNIQMVAGAPVVNCPYCHSTYQLTEEPKW